MLRLTAGCVTKERVNGGEVVVARSDRVPAVTLEVVEEGADQWGVEVAEVEMAALDQTVVGRRCRGSCPSSKASIITLG